MKVRRAALLVISGAIILPSMMALAVWMTMHSGATFVMNPTGPDHWIHEGNAWVMATVYLLLTGLCAFWIGLLGAVGSEDE